MAELHPATWLVWLAAAALPALTTRNPLYLALAGLAAGVTHLALARGNRSAQGWTAFVRLGAWLWLFTVPFTMLTSHHGQIVLFRLPAHWPVIGGPITGEALLYGISSGLALLTLLLAFAAFNVAVDQAKLLRMMPSFVYQVGVVLSIAVAFVPQLVATWQAVREAQEVRGYRLRGPRSLLPLIMPLLITALERAMQLAESMEARGFGTETAPASLRRQNLRQLGLLAGMLSLGAGGVGAWFWPQARLLSGLCLFTGAVLLGVSLWDQGRTVRRSHYQRWYFGRTDRLLSAGYAVVAVVWLGVLIWRGDWLFYYPYPPYSPWPPFQPLLGLLLVAPVLPGLFGKPEGQSRRPDLANEEPSRGTPPCGASLWDGDTHRYGEQPGGQPACAQAGEGSDLGASRSVE